MTNDSKYIFVCLVVIHTSLFMNCVSNSIYQINKLNYEKLY